MGAAIAVLGLVGLALWQRPVIPPPPSDTTHPSPPNAARRKADEEGVRLPEGLPDMPPGDTPLEPMIEGDAGLEGESMGGTWQTVDMDTVRAALPDNLYWHLSQPTTDEEVIEERARERARWNVEYGKVLSGTGSEEEIRAYYDYKSRLYGDYIEFSTHLLDHYGTELPPRDVALLQLARRLHQARLEEVPRKLEEAFERKRAQDAARAAWLADQAAFEADAAAPANGQ